LAVGGGAGLEGAEAEGFVRGEPRRDGGGRGPGEQRGEWAAGVGGEGGEVGPEGEEAVEEGRIGRGDRREFVRVHTG